MENGNKKAVRKATLVRDAGISSGAAAGHVPAGNDTLGGHKVAGVDLCNILDALPFYVLLVDEKHHVIYANRAVRNDLGVTPEDLIGQYCPKVVHGVDGPFEGCPLEEAAHKGEAIEREVFDKEKDRWILSAIYPTGSFTSQGSRVFFHMVSDISDRKEAEQELKASHEKLHLLSEHLESAREEERKRIARDLHDDTGQLLASLSAHLGAVTGLLPPDATKARAALNNAQTITGNVIDQLQKLIYELRPLLLDDLGLVAAVRWLADNSLKKAGVDVTFKVKGTSRRLGLQTETTVFRVVQEAVNNIIRHARATDVGIDLYFKKNSVKVSIEDNGTGFDLEKATSSKGGMRGFGLMGMRERVELARGTFSLTTQPGQGTRIIFEIPLDQDAPEE